MLPVLRLRRLISVVVTGVFFAVAALGITDGAATLDAFVRAGIASLVVALLAIALLRTVEDALARIANEKVGGSGTTARLGDVASADESGER